MKRIVLLAWTAALVGVVGIGAAVAAPMAVPADGRIVIRDYGYRDWGPELVHYTVDPAKFATGACGLNDADGKQIPCQVDDGILTFVASLGKGKTAEYRLTAGPGAASPIRLSQADGHIEIGNEHFALRAPSPGEKSYATPVAAGDVPPPVLAWQAAGGPWFGGARFVTERRVAAATFRLVSQGPACIIYEARYRFVPAGEYVWRATVAAGLDRAEIAEEFDFGAITAGQDFLLLDVQSGLSAERIGVVVAAGDTGGQTRRQPLAEYLAPKLKDGANPPAPVGGQGATPMPPRPQAGMVLLEKIAAGGRWGDLRGGIELRGAGEGDQPPPGRVAVVPLHVGSWRRAVALTVWHQEKAGVVVALPISVRPVTWYSEVTDDISPFSTHEHDSGLKESYGRREWALYFGATPEVVQSTVGYIGLDTFKEWILDWPETAKAGDYPRAWYTREGVARLKQSLDRHPDREAFGRYYVFSGRTEDAIEHGRQAAEGMLAQFGYLGDWNVGGLSHYRQAQSLAAPAALADDALACPELPAELRRELRRALAVGAYLISNPDLNPRGAGVHLGNNNMPINRTSTLLYFAGLLPDHPLYGYWMQKGTEFIQFKLGTYIAPDGAPNEPPMYQLYGPLRFLSDAVTVIHNTGGPDLARKLLDNGRYLATMTMPDARFDGRRILPGMGNSGNFLDSCYGFLIADADRLDKDTAGLLQAVYRRAWPTEPLGSRWGNHMGMAFRYLPDVPESRAPLTTTVFPTYGVMFRAHYDTPGETAMLFRIGANWGHWDTDALNLVLYGKGAPLSPGTGYQYYYGPATEGNAIYHNRVKLGQPDLQEVFGRVDNELRDYGFGPYADYAAGSRYFPPEVFPDAGGEAWWNRHVMFLKSPRPDGANYFVVRDTFTAATPRPSWWTWMNLEGADRIRADGVAFEKDKAPYNRRAPETEMEARTGRVLELGTDYGAATWMAFSEPQAFRVRMTFDYDVGNSSRLGFAPEFLPRLPGKETKTIIESVGKPGQEYFYVIYPRRNGEPAPTVTSPAPGCLKVVTPEGTDYVFLNDAPAEVKADDVTFSGKAGAVRVLGDRIALCLNAGTGSLGYKGCAFAGAGPFERVLKPGELKPGETKVTDTYEKAWRSVEIGEGLTVRGEGPFTARLDGKVIRVSVEGRARELFVTKPAWMRWVRYWVDGAEHMACWTDYPASGWGRYANTALIAVTVPDGKHELEIRDCVYPAVWTREFSPRIEGVALPE